MPRQQRSGTLEERPVMSAHEDEEEGNRGGINELSGRNEKRKMSSGGDSYLPPYMQAWTGIHSRTEENTVGLVIFGLGAAYANKLWRDNALIEGIRLAAQDPPVDRGKISQKMVDSGRRWASFGNYKWEDAVKDYKATGILPLRSKTRLWAAIYIGGVAASVPAAYRIVSSWFISGKRNK